MAENFHPMMTTWSGIRKRLSGTSTRRKGWGNSRRSRPRRWSHLRSMRSSCGWAILSRSMSLMSGLCFRIRIESCWWRRGFWRIRFQMRWRRRWGRSESEKSRVSIMRMWGCLRIWFWRFWNRVWCLMSSWRKRDLIERRSSDDLRRMRGCWMSENEFKGRKSMRKLWRNEVKGIRCTRMKRRLSIISLMIESCTWFLKWKWTRLR